MPFTYRWDANSHGMLVKSVLDHGWYERNPNLGAPFQQEFNDFPMADNLHLVVAKLFGLFTSDYALVVNLYYLLGYPLIALSAFLALRSLRLSGGVAAVLSLLYAFAPYHVMRGEMHLFLSAYYSVPLAVYLILGAMDHHPLFAASERRGFAKWITPRTLGTVATCALIGSSSTYYAAFTALLLLAALTFRAATRSGRRSLLTGIAILAFIAGFQFLNLLPDIVYRLQHGTNPTVDTRDASDSETYSLRFAQLMLPVPNHRVDGLAKIANRYLEEYSVPSEPHPLGAAAAVGFIWLLAIPLLLLTGARPSWVGHVERDIAFLNLTAFLIGMTGGLSALIGAVITTLRFPTLRSWNRISIFIAFFSLVALGRLLDRLKHRAQMRKRRVFVHLFVLVLLGAGLLDQTTKDAIPDYSSTKREFASDAAFVETIERRLGPGRMVFQFPYVAFPESPAPYKMLDYDLLRGYLHSGQIRWSYGGIKGRREADWQARLVTRPPEVFVPMLSAIGFDGIYVDRFGYSDSGRDLEQMLSLIVGAQPISSQDGRLSFFDLRPYGRQLRASHSKEEIAQLKAAGLLHDH